MAYKIDLIDVGGSPIGNGMKAELLGDDLLLGQIEVNEAGSAVFDVDTSTYKRLALRLVPFIEKTD